MWICPSRFGKVSVGGNEGWAQGTRVLPSHKAGCQGTYAWAAHPTKYLDKHKRIGLKSGRSGLAKPLVDAINSTGTRFKAYFSKVLHIVHVGVS